MTTYGPLHDPERDKRDWVPPLDTALDVARQTLEEKASANIHEHDAMLRAAVALDQVLRQLLAALDAEAGERRG